MKKARLLRYRRTYRETFGVFLCDGASFYILEPSWRDNKRNISCIPAGTYRVKYMHRSASGKYRRCYHVQGVPDRSGILIHCGNTYKHTRGCMLPGRRVGLLAGNNAVLNSRSALTEMVKLMGNEFELEVVDGLVD